MTDPTRPTSPPTDGAPRAAGRPRTVATLSEPSFIATKKQRLEIFQREVRR